MILSFGPSTRQWLDFHREFSALETNEFAASEKCNQVFANSFRYTPEFVILVQYVYARFLHKCGRFDDAQKLFKGILKSDYGTERIRSRCCERLAGLCVFDRDIRSADYYWGRALYHQPRDPHLLCEYATFLYQNYWDSHHVNAEHLFKQALIVAPRDSHVIAGYANFLLESDRPRLARAQFELALEMSPRNDAILVNYATLLYSPHDELKDFHAAVRYLKKAAKRNPRNVDALANLGKIKANIFGEYADAEKYLKQALKLDPLHVHARYFYYVLLKFQLNQEHMAEIHRDQHYEHCNGMPWTRNEVLDYCYTAQYLHEKSRDNEAMEYIMRAVEMDTVMNFEMDAELTRIFEEIAPSGADLEIWSERPSVPEPGWPPNWNPEPDEDPNVVIIPVEPGGYESGGQGGDYYYGGGQFDTQPEFFDDYGDGFNELFYDEYGYPYYEEPEYDPFVQVVGDGGIVFQNLDEPDQQFEVYGTEAGYGHDQQQYDEYDQGYQYDQSVYDEGQYEGVEMNDAMYHTNSVPLEPVQVQDESLEDEDLPVKQPVFGNVVGVNSDHELVKRSSERLSKAEREYADLIKFFVSEGFEHKQVVTLADMYDGDQTAMWSHLEEQARFQQRNQALLDLADESASKIGSAASSLPMSPLAIHGMNWEIDEKQEFLLDEVREDDAIPPGQFDEVYAQPYEQFEEMFDDLSLEEWLRSVGFDAMYGYLVQLGYDSVDSMQYLVAGDLDAFGVPREDQNVLIRLAQLG